jgi:8-oxo-dGTP pyrophosphatase MutT (NUDIX family)
MPPSPDRLQSPHPLPLDKALCDRLKTNLAAHDVAELPREGRKHAAVAFTLVEQAGPAGIANIPYDESTADQAAFILTVRAARLSSHAGQRAYPGGRVDPGETVVEAALRELREEVGLSLGPEHVIGRLDDYATRSGFLISPVVLWGGHDVSLEANPAEVASIHRIPLNELLREDAPILESIPQSRYPVLKMPLGDDWVAAPSAAVCYQFREVALQGRNTRVAHFEQPVFAWK